jgi:hypothetical protein
MSLRSVTTVALILAIPCLRGQEAWDSSFKLVGAQLIGAKDAHLGSNTNWAIALEGSYPIFPKGSLVLEGGYRTLLRSTTIMSSSQSVDYWSNGIYGSVLYRHTKFQGILEGLYLQGGLRYNSLTANQEQTSIGAGPGGSDLKVQTKGAEVSNVGPVVGVGYRLSEKISLEFNIFRVKGQSADVPPAQKTCSGLELALGIHL